MSRATQLGKYYRMDDGELPWVYAYTEESGGIFGLEMDSLLTSTFFRKSHLSVSYAKHTSRMMARSGIVTGPVEVGYVASHGDGTSHGATWANFAKLLEPLSELGEFRKIDDRNLELQLDGLQNMALEGANRHDGGWSVIHEGLVDARDDMLNGLRWRQAQLYQGLGELATNFSEREEAAMSVVAA